MKQITQTFSEGVNPTLRYLNFCPSSFDHVGKWLDKKASVNFKIMT